MMRAEKIATDINEANELLSWGAAPMAVLTGLVRRLERKAAEAPGLVEPVVNALDRAIEALGEAQDALEAVIRESDFDPKVLERTEERLFALRAAARKYSVAVEELPALRDRMDADLADLDAGVEKLSHLEAAARQAGERYDEAAAQLSEARRLAARQLEMSVMAELPALKLERAEFIVELSSDPKARAPEGIDTVEYWVRTNPGTRPGPMMKVASGGELSRFLLALKVALADRGSAPTLVFDEIDAGVGGAVADAIGQRLARLARRVQVLSDTHAPQVAARADSHFLIAKDGGETVRTSVAAIAVEQRQEEIARMLAGATVTQEARAAAERLLKEKSGL